MRIENFSLPEANILAKDYKHSFENVQDMFNYDYHNQEVYQKRLEELYTRKFQRDALANYLFTYNRKFNCSHRTVEYIEKIKNKESVVVVGGQQAGILTGPLYTIHKCISILKFAKEKESILGIPVIPIFWIAGEDHDYDEINHVYIKKNDSAEKLILQAEDPVKTSASLMKWDKEQAVKWSDGVFQQFGETEFTKDIVKKVHHIFDASDTIVDSFAHLLTYLFGDYGLVLLDSGDPNFKQLQSEYLVNLIEKNEEVDRRFVEGLKTLQNKNYPRPIEYQENNAHLFLYINRERVLLFRDGTGGFRSKEGDVRYTKDQLMQMAKEKPHLFSNNVVTRPLMQEWVLPTLSFIAGSGEIAYWSALKPIFNEFSLKMPPLIPRLSLTIVSKQTQKQLDDTGLEAKHVIKSGTEVEKKAWYEAHKPYEIEPLITDSKQQMAKIHKELSGLAEKIDKSLVQLSTINLNRILHEVDYLHHKMEKKMKKRFKEPLEKFDAVALELLPFHKLQERTWNIFYYMNDYGFDLIHDLMNESLPFDDQHKIVYI